MDTNNLRHNGQRPAWWKGSSDGAKKGWYEKVGKQVCTENDMFQANYSRLEQCRAANHHANHLAWLQVQEAIDYLNSLVEAMQHAALPEREAALQEREAALLLFEMALTEREGALHEREAALHAGLQEREHSGVRDCVSRGLVLVLGDSERDAGGDEYWTADDESGSES